MWETDKSTNMGLPPPGVELKLVPMDGKLEARLRGPNITPGYWRQPELTAQAFDEEGFYRLGDALKFDDPDDPGKGLLFDGRTAEDFKLGSGTWVSVGPLRAQMIEALAPLCSDAVIAGADRDEIGVLLFPDIDACRALLGSAEERRCRRRARRSASVRAAIRERLERLARQRDRQFQPRLPRACCWTAPPSLDAARSPTRARSISARCCATAHDIGGGALCRSSRRPRVSCSDASRSNRMTGVGATFDDAWLLDGVRTPFADYNGPLALVSPIDLGIKVAREVLERAEAEPTEVGTVITGSMAQASFDAYMLPRHIGLYAGVPIEVPALHVQRVCGTGIEVLDAGGRRHLARPRRSCALRRHRIDEPQSDRRLYPSRRLPHGAGRVQGLPVGGADGPGAAGHHGRHRRDAWRGATRSRGRRSTSMPRAAFERAVAAQEDGFLAGEITPVQQRDLRAGRLQRPRHQAARRQPWWRPTRISGPRRVEALAKIRPAFGGVQTGGNSSAIVDGAAAALVVSEDYLDRHGTDAAGAARCRRGGRRRRPRSWASARCRRSMRCWSAPGST